MNDNHPEIRRLRLYYSDQIRPLEEKITELVSEIISLNHIIEDREYGLSDELLCGFDTGRVDSNGKPIRCGDTIEFYEFKEGYTEQYSEDGWGREIRLCSHDQYEVPNKKSIIRGVVTYSSKWTGFVVQFDEYMLNTARDEQLLYILLLSAFPNDKKNKLNVVSTYQS